MEKSNEQFLAEFLELTLKPTIEGMMGAYKTVGEKSAEAACDILLKNMDGFVKQHMMLMGVRK